MSLNLVEDDQVLEAAMSLLDECNRGDAKANKKMAASKKKKPRNYNPNRAREEQRKELLALRDQVPELEKRLLMLQRQLQNANSSAMTMGQKETIELWRKMALYQRQTRLNAEEENKRLRELVREHAEVSTRNIQHLLQFKQGHAETIERLPEAWPYRRQYAVPLGSSDSSLFRELADSIDFVHRQVLRVFSMNEVDTDVTLFPSTKDAHPRLFADKILPYSVELTGDAAWQFFAHSFRRPTTRFYYHAESSQTTGLVRDDTIVESFGEEHRFGKVLLDFKVKQIVRRYMVAGRVVIAWRAILSPERFKAESLSGIQFEEKGALVIEPYQVAQPSGGHETASVVHTWQMITPDINGAANGDRRKLVHDMTEYVLHGCRPGRAVESMERTLRAQTTQSMAPQVVLPTW